MSRIERRILARRMPGVSAEEINAQRQADRQKALDLRSHMLSLRRQKYINMGISMISGISGVFTAVEIPQALWVYHNFDYAPEALRVASDRGIPVTLGVIMLGGIAGFLYKDWKRYQVDQQLRERYSWHRVHWRENPYPPKMNEGIFEGNYQEIYR